MTEIKNYKDNNESRIRKILLIGKTGNGKSALANVLSNTNNFEESEKSISKTKDFQAFNFEEDLNGTKITYRIIDTIGIGDTKLNEKEVLNKISLACQEVVNGIDQILFVISGRFTKEEIEVYNLLRQTIFDESVVSYTTIVRTNFPEFENESKCEEDRQDIVREDSKLSELINSCNKVIYIDNPPLVGRAAEINRQIREISRNIVLKHLMINCSEKNPICLQKISDRILNFMNEKEILQNKLEQMEKLNQENEDLIRINQEKIKNLEEKIEIEISEKLSFKTLLDSKHWCIIS